MVGQHAPESTKGRALNKIIGEMKSFTSRSLRKEIGQHSGESRREWMLWMMKGAGIENGNNNDWSRMLSGATT